MSLTVRRAQLDADRSRGCGPAAFCIAIAACGAVVLGAGGSACAQSMTVPGQQSLVHDRANTPQVFPEVIWQLHSSIDSGGYTTQWQCGPFVHSVHGALRADAKLAIRVVASEGFADWAATVPSDQTALGSGDETAAVAAQSIAIGDGHVGLTVSFLNDDYSRLAAGNYTVTVVGTITAN